MGKQLEARRLLPKNKKMKGIIALILFPCFCGSNAPLVGKSIWKTVANFLTLGKEKKFNGSHKSFSGISSDHEYADVSEKIIKELDPRGKVPWRFFEHSESGNYLQKMSTKRTAGESLRFTGPRLTIIWKLGEC